MRIPAWVEVTEGEVPATLSYHGSGRHRPRVLDARTESSTPSNGKRKQPSAATVITGLWGNGTIRVLTGFLTLYIAFVAKAKTDHEPIMQAAMLGLVGAAAAIGNFAGNATGARFDWGVPPLIVVRCAAAVVVVAAIVAATDNLLTAALAALVAPARSALAKVSLDASLQQDLPEESIASGFGRSETVLQLSWVLGGAMGVLLPTEFWIGFSVVSVILTSVLCRPCSPTAGDAPAGTRRTQARTWLHRDRHRADRSSRWTRNRKWESMNLQARTKKTIGS